MISPAGNYGCVGEHCVTCSDEAIAMTVIRVDDARELALCEDARGTRSTVEIALVTPVADGDRVLVHAGVAIATPGDGEGREAPAAARPGVRQGAVLGI
jgi:hydrogenase expression/formation protein HypC